MSRIESQTRRSCVKEANYTLCHAELVKQRLQPCITGGESADQLLIEKRLAKIASDRLLNKDKGKIGPVGEMYGKQPKACLGSMYK